MKDERRAIAAVGSGIVPFVREPANELHAATADGRLVEARGRLWPVDLPWIEREAVVLDLERQPWAQPCIMMLVTTSVEHRSRRSANCDGTRCVCAQAFTQTATRASSDRSLVTTRRSTAVSS